MTSSTEADAPDPRRWAALAVLALVQFILVLDITVVNVALPAIQKSLDFSRPNLAWVVDGYVMTAGGLLLLGGRLADLLGRKRMFLIGLGLFIIASVASGAASSSGMLVGSRFAQGAGEAFAAPAAFGLIVLLFTDPVERAKAIGIFGGIAGAGGTFGPIISGILIKEASWRWIFLVNIPVGLFSMIAVTQLVKESRAQERGDGGRPDIAGAVLITAAFTGVVYGLIQAATDSWGSASVLAPLLGGLALLVVFGVLESRLREPLVPMRFFHNRTRVTTNAVTILFTAAFFTMFFLLTLYFQEVKHWSPLKTGFAYLPFGVGIGGGIGLASAFVPRIGVKRIIALGFALFGIGMLWMSNLTPHTVYWLHLMPAFVLAAVGSGFTFAGVSNASVHEVTIEDASLASGVQNAVQQVGGGIGLAVLATLALRHANAQIASGTAPNVAATNGDALVFAISAAIMAVGAVLVVLLLGQVQTAESDSPLAASQEA